MKKCTPTAKVNRQTTPFLVKRRTDALQPTPSRKGPGQRHCLRRVVWRKKTRNNPKVVCRFCCRFDKRFRSDQASQSRLQSRKSLKSDPSVTIIRKAWTNDPGRLYSGHRVFLKRQSPVSLDVPFDDAVRAIHADPQNKPRMSQNHNSLAYLLNRWPRWSLS